MFSCLQVVKQAPFSSWLKVRVRVRVKPQIRFMIFPATLDLINLSNNNFASSLF